MIASDVAALQLSVGVRLACELHYIRQYTAEVGNNPLSTLTPPVETANTGNTDEHRK
jgi:hypothetical protein